MVTNEGPDLLAPPCGDRTPKEPLPSRGIRKKSAKVNELVPGRHLGPTTNQLSDLVQRGTYRSEIKVPSQYYPEVIPMFRMETNFCLIADPYTRLPRRSGNSIPFPCWTSLKSELKELSLCNVFGIGESF